MTTRTLTRLPGRWRKPLGALAAAGLLVTAGTQSTSTPSSPGAPALRHAIGGPYAALLSASADLGPAGADPIRLTAALHGRARPAALIEWARSRGLSVRWRSGANWAVIEGAATAVSAALEVAVHDYRARRGQQYYASPQQPTVPEALRAEVAELGRILGYTPFRERTRWMLPLDVPDQGLSPQALLRTYNVEPLRDRGFTGKDTTVVVFAFDGFDQPDLDMFADGFGLRRFTPETLGGMASQRSGEATMDLEAIHAVAPDARTVLVNARPTVEGDGSYEKIADLMDEAARKYPGAVWSFSIGWGCDKIVNAADLAPVRAALVSAHRSGITAFDASGDLAGLECKGGDNWATPPGPDEVGLDAIASIPEMTSVGGTTVSTDASGNWLSEQTWFDVPLSQGTGGGVSGLFDRPDWQDWIDIPKGVSRRLTPDIAAVSDPNTGMVFAFGGRLLAGGGTSLATPVWAGITAVMNQYLVEHGGQRLGDINPLLYEAAQGARLPGFHDIPLGANAVDRALHGYDLVTGLGTPNVANLVEDLLVVQRSRGLAR